MRALSHAVVRSRECCILTISFVKMPSSTSATSDIGISSGLSEMAILFGRLQQGLVVFQAIRGQTLMKPSWPIVVRTFCIIKREYNNLK